ncbi:MAG: hypothetical protein LN590_06870 [Rickettsia endosymbiont of Glossina mortisans submortisans]|nr:hypothetical protein [Rickettsia endosymbiont of Glossina mortisans submortisans]
MKSQHQNFQKHLNGNYSNQEATMMQTQAVLNQDNRICYKSRREELNRRVQSIVEQKKQVVSTKN